MNKKSQNRKPGNETIKRIYEGYRDEMKKTLELEEWAPHKFANVEFVEHFERKVEKLDTLIALYADLLLTYKNLN